MELPEISPQRGRNSVTRNKNESVTEVTREQVAEGLAVYTSYRSASKKKKLSVKSESSDEIRAPESKSSRYGDEEADKMTELPEPLKGGSSMAL